MSDIKEAIQKIANTFKEDKMGMFLGSVKSVQESERTCTVTQLTGANDTDIEGIFLSPENNDGFLQVPSIGSTVLVITSTNSERYVAMFSEIEYVKIYTNKEIWLNGDGLGGLAIVEKIQNNLDSIKDYLNTLKSSISSGLTSVGVGSAANGGTAATAFDTSMVAASISFKDMENKNVKHG